MGIAGDFGDIDFLKRPLATTVACKLNTTHVRLIYGGADGDHMII